MKFAFLLTQLEVGGAQVRVMQTAQELRARGHSADIYFLYQKRACFEDEAKTILSRSKSPLDLLKGIGALFSALRNGKYDVLITNTAPANLIGNLAGFLVGPKTRLAVQTQPPARLNRIVRIADRIWGTVGIYHKIIANSKWTYSCFDSYPSSYKTRLDLIENGIRPRVFEGSKEEARQILGLAPDEKLLVNIGRMSRQKGQDTAIRAMQAIEGARLVIIGAGELDAQLRELVRELKLESKVQFAGEVSGPVVAQYLAAADIFLFPSRWETFGLAAVEAAAANLPIVCTDLDVLKDVLQDENGVPAALFCNVDDASAFSSACNLVLSDPARAADMRVRSGETFKRHSIERHVDIILTKV